SITQVRIWRDSQSLWRHAMAVDPASAFAHYELGNVFVMSGRTPEARAQYERGLALLGHTFPRAEAMFRARLGAVLPEQGELAGAEWYYREALRLYPGNIRARNNLAVILAGR